MMLEEDLRVKVTEESEGGGDVSWARRREEHVIIFAFLCGERKGKERKVRTEQGKQRHLGGEDSTIG